MVYIGTSGWVYQDWRNNFYPAGLKQEKWLGFYGREFRTVEINNSFYQLPVADTFMNWASEVPDDFIFAVKANRYITHMKNLLDPAETTAKLFARVRLLSEHLGPLLFQLSPHWRVNQDRLANFIQYLPADLRSVFEFRHPSWYQQSIFSLLEKNNIGLCLHDHVDAPMPSQITADFVYIRLHGLQGKYLGEYSQNAIGNWRQRIQSWIRRELDVYTFFNNDANANVIANARQLRGELE